MGLDRRSKFGAGTQLTTGGDPEKGVGGRERETRFVKGGGKRDT